MTHGLEPLAPVEAVEMYLEHRESELAEKSLQNQRYRLRSFVEWAEERGLDNLNDLTGRDIHRFRVWRRNGDGQSYGEVSTLTLRGILQTLRTFLEFCASIDAVEPGMRERVLLPEVDAEDESSDQKVSATYMRELLDHLDRFQYASRDHVIVAILWHTGIRLGSLRALDVGDFEPADPCLRLRHRPETGTPLKNGAAAERSIAVGDHYGRVIQDYFEHSRIEARDEFGRRPLISSKQGRLTEVPIRRTIYQWTRPCLIGDCPHGKDPQTCEWTHTRKASGCPSSRSPHAVRRGAITKHLRDGVPEQVVGDRMNVGTEVIDRHYDRRTEREKMETRREFLTES